MSQLNFKHKIDKYRHKLSIDPSNDVYKKKYDNYYNHNTTFLINSNKSGGDAKKKIHELQQQINAQYNALKQTKIDIPNFSETHEQLKTLTEKTLMETSKLFNFFKEKIENVHNEIKYCYSSKENCLQEINFFNGPFFDIQNAQSNTTELVSKQKGGGADDKPPQTQMDNCTRTKQYFDAILQSLTDYLHEITNEHNVSNKLIPNGNNYELNYFYATKQYVDVFSYLLSKYKKAVELHKLCMNGCGDIEALKTLEITNEGIPICVDGNILDEENEFLSSLKQPPVPAQYAPSQINEKPVDGVPTLFNTKTSTNREISQSSTLVPTVVAPATSQSQKKV